MINVDTALRVKRLVEESLAQQFLRGYSVDMPDEEHQTQADSVPIGYLGKCPRSNALERRSHPVRFGGKSWKDSTYVVNRVREGSADEKAVINALAWSSRDGGIDATFRLLNTQVNVSSANREGVARLHGRADAIIELNGEPVLLELKSSQFGKLYNWMIFQLLGYMLVTGITSGLIVQKSGALIKVYALVPEGQGYRVYDHEGKLWEHPMNSPTFLNFERVHGMATIMHEYLAMEDEKLLATRPIADPLNPLSAQNEYAFGDSDPQCVTYEEKPKALKKELRPGLAKPACGHWCHDHIAQDDTTVVVGITQEGYVHPAQELQEPTETPVNIRQEYVPEAPKPVKEDTVFDW